MSSESVRLSGFTPTSYDFVSRLAEDRFGHPAGSYARPTVIPIESAATLFFLLRLAPDDEFPAGKWAVIQHLEGLIETSLADSNS